MLGRSSMPVFFDRIHLPARVGLLGIATFWSSFADAQTNVFPARFSRDQVEFYEKRVQPLLAENCYKCHSHQADKIKGGFVLDSRAGLLKGGDDGPAIVPGDAARSLLIKAVRHVGGDLRMPPQEKLPDEQTAVPAPEAEM